MELLRRHHRISQQLPVAGVELPQLPLRRCEVVTVPSARELHLQVCVNRCQAVGAEPLQLRRLRSMSMRRLQLQRLRRRRAREQTAEPGRMLWPTMWERSRTRSLSSLMPGRHVTSSPLRMVSTLLRTI